MTNEPPAPELPPQARARRPHYPVLVRKGTLELELGDRGLRIRRGQSWVQLTSDEETWMLSEIARVRDLVRRGPPVTPPAGGGPP